MARSFAKRRAPRLKSDFQELDSLCERSEVISYEVISKDGSNPDAYRITYNLKSIIGVGPNRKPIYGHTHVAEIRFPAMYPKSQPVCKMISDVWHPNIRYSGKTKGHICINEQSLGPWHNLEMLVIRIGRILQYKNYHTKNVAPWPEDPTAAKWVREYAEPHNIINKKRGIYVDNTPLFNASEEWTETREMKPPIKPNTTISIKNHPDPIKKKNKKIIIKVNKPKD